VSKAKVFPVPVGASISETARLYVSTDWSFAMVESNVRRRLDMTANCGA